MKPTYVNIDDIFQHREILKKIDNIIRDRDNPIKAVTTQRYIQELIKYLREHPKKKFSTKTANELLQLVNKMSRLEQIKDISNGPLLIDRLSNSILSRIDVDKDITPEAHPIYKKNIIPETPPNYRKNTTSKVLPDSPEILSNTPKNNTTETPESIIESLKTLTDSLSMTQSKTKIDNLTMSQLGPKTASGGAEIDKPTENITSRMTSEGHFMTHLARPSTSKTDLFQPVGSKRSAENIDPLAQKIDIVPYWDTNGLENIGYLPPTAIVDNGSFNKPVSTNPQKFVFMTYKSGINQYYNCKLPMKVNIPSGDFGIYKVIVNEVLFRTDMDLLEIDDYIDLTFNDPVRLELRDTNGTVLGHYPQTIVTIPSIRLPISTLFPNVKNVHINALNIDLLQSLLTLIIQALNQEIYKFDTSISNFYPEDGGTTDNVKINPPLESTTIKLENILKINKQNLGGLGLYFSLVDYELGTVNTNQKVYFNAGSCTFNISSCSNNFRHIFPPLQTTTVITSSQNTFYNPISGSNIVSTVNSIYIPRCNFAGPQLILLNSSAQTTCPISNEYARQFNTCALSYNTNEDTNSLVQMTSNVELTMKNTNEFRVWLTDNYGEPIKIQSPIYVQVTVQPFINEASSGVSE